MSFLLPDPTESAAAPTQSRSTTPPNVSATATNASTTPMGHANFVLPSAGTYGAVQLSTGFSSPQRDPTLASTTNGQISVQADEDRGQLRNELRDRIHVINSREPSEDNFWEEILSTNAVREATVTGIRNAIQDDIDHLCELAKKKNPLEAEMYPALMRIFDAIEPGDHTSTAQTRIWKDHHTKYPGVDSEVLISGLQDKGERQDESTIGGESIGSLISTKRRKTAKDAYLPAVPAGKTDDDGQRGSQRNGDDFKRKNTPNSTLKQVLDPRKPDWILLDADSAGLMPANPLWRQIAVIFELKASSGIAPTKGDPKSSLVVQCADYARLHLALRPFQRFSIHFSLCGNLFNAWLIDRAGVIISDTVDIGTDEGADTFIRALVQVTTDLTMYELGMDPTVAVEEESCLGDSTIPRFTVTMPSGNLYTTKGPPIWQSSSLFGRGTVVWKVEEGTAAKHGSTMDAPTQDTLITDSQERPELILKSAYHHPDRIAESKFYEAINQANHPGVAVFLEGGDVMHNGEKLTTATHRQGLTLSDQDPVAHRLVLKSKGRRLSECKNVLELLEAVLAGVRGHEALFKHGIIHRDISIGNVFISDDPDTTAGFLGDLDMAKVYDADRLAGLVGREKAQEMVKSTSQGSITGTAQFMSLSLLDHHTGLQDEKRLKGVIGHSSNSDFHWRPSRWTDTDTESPGPPSSSNPMPHDGSQPHLQARINPAFEPPHNNNLESDRRSDTDWELAARNDLESFIWVMLYALCAQEMNSKPLTNGQNGREWHCRELFMPLFGGVSFARTLADHLLAARYIRGEDSRLTWKEALIPLRRYWDILCDLLRCAVAGRLNHARFQKLLMHYIGEEKRYMEAHNESQC